MQTRQRLEILSGVRRVVIKIGSGVLGSPDGGLDPDILDRLAKDICSLESDGRFETVIVSSGAVMGGRNILGLTGGKLSISQKQASAAVGQVKLMKLYEEFFSKNGRKAAQILLTHGDIEDRSRYMNVRNTITTLLEMKVIPIINENDSTAVEELKFGDNDTLSAKIASVVETDLLLILSDVDGLYSSDPRNDPSAKLVEEVQAVDEAVMGMAGESGTASGTGGMRAKVKAAGIASAYGVPAWIVGGRNDGAIRRALREGKGGTFFHPVKNRLSARTHWIGHILTPQGEITVDKGARRAIIDNGKSLLPSGVLEVTGTFVEGDAVAILDQNGDEFARALVNYDSAELAKIKGRKSSEIEQTLGYKKSDEVFHRDNMAPVKGGVTNVQRT